MGFWICDAVSAENRIACFVEGAQFVSPILARSAPLMSWRSRLMPRTDFDDSERSAQVSILGYMAEVRENLRIQNEECRLISDH